MNDCLMVHSVSGSTKNNASKFTHNTIQGHHHSLFEISYYADKATIRWSMSCGCLQDPNGIAARYATGNVLKRPILGCGLIKGEMGTTLVIPDLHLPYHHRDAFPFLKAVHAKYKCNKVINTGDLFDHHRGSYHESEPDALDAETEYELAKDHAHALQKLFPKMVITIGNHDAIPTRKAKTVGLPASMLSNMNAVYGLKGGWEWVDEYYFDTKNGEPTLVPMVLNKRGRWVGKLK